MTIHLVRLFALFAGTQVRSFFFPRVDQRALHDARCCCELASAHAAKLAGFWGQEKKRSKWTRCLGAPNTCWPAPCALGTFPPCSWFGVRERHTPHAPLATRRWRWLRSGQLAGQSGERRLRGCTIEWRVVWAAPWPCGPPSCAAMCRAGSRRSSQEEEKHVLWWELAGFGRFWSKLCSTQHDVSQFDRMRGRHHA